jgi:hypothetical protein
MFINKPFVAFTFACPGAEAQRQVFSPSQAEPIGSLFLSHFIAKHIPFLETVKVSGQDSPTGLLALLWNASMEEV